MLCPPTLESDVGHTTWHVIDILYILFYALLILLTSSNNGTPLHMTKRLSSYTSMLGIAVIVVV